MLNLFVVLIQEVDLIVIIQHYKSLLIGQAGKWARIEVAEFLEFKAYFLLD